MNVTIYNTPTGAEHVVKDISAGTVVATYSGNARGEISVDRPVIEIEDMILTGNYAYIADFGRYYWISERNVLRTGLTELVLHSDALFSFWQTGQLQTLPVYVTRTIQRPEESNNNCGYNTYIPDRFVQKTARTFTIVKIDENIPKFEYPDSPLNTERQYILGVIG